MIELFAKSHQINARVVARNDADIALAESFARL